MTTVVDQPVSPTAGRNARKIKKSERVAMEIVRSVVASGAQEGDHLPLETDMLAEYGVSRASLREGLRLLEVQGLITIKPGPHGGPLVGTVDPASLAHTFTLYFHLGHHTYGELFEAQIRLEPVCAAQAARHPDRQAVHAAMQPYRAPEAFTARRRRPSATAFNDAIYDLAGNGVLTLLTRAISHVVAEHVFSALSSPELAASLDAQRRALADAIVAGQAVEAAKLTERGLREQIDFYHHHGLARFDETIEWR
jgi:DNA-binding FadR family transcriptional regulator